MSAINSPMDLMSSRAVKSLADPFFKTMIRIQSNMYDKKINPSGIFSMGVAENLLMHDDLSDFLNKNLKVDNKMFMYGDNMHLKQLLVELFEERFNASIQPWMITLVNGVTTAIDTVCYNLFEEGDGILCSKPLYAAFPNDVHLKANCNLVLVDAQEDCFDKAVVGKYKDALLKAEKRGIKVRGLLLCHPHNPLGQCYPEETLIELLKFAEEYNLHFISDEIYALSVFPSDDIPKPTPFTSVLTLQKYISAHRLHVLYGMSKDFCANGLRLGAIISLIPEQARAMTISGLVYMPSSLSTKSWEIFLQDKKFTDTFLSTMIKRLTASYNEVASFLRRNDIKYIPSNAGHFIFADFSSYTDTKGGLMSEADAGGILTEQLLQGGLYLGSAESFFGRPGWFRITFSLPKDELDFGLDRLNKILSKLPKQKAKTAQSGFENLTLE